MTKKLIWVIMQLIYIQMCDLFSILYVLAGKLEFRVIRF